MLLQNKQWKAEKIKDDISAIFSTVTMFSFIYDAKYCQTNIKHIMLLKSITKTYFILTPSEIIVTILWNASRKHTRNKKDTFGGAFF